MPRRGPRLLPCGDEDNIRSRIAVAVANVVAVVVVVVDPAPLAGRHRRRPAISDDEANADTDGIIAWMPRCGAQTTATATTTAAAASDDHVHR
jgi:hypothetical protein